MFLGDTHTGKTSVRSPLNDAELYRALRKVMSEDVERRRRGSSSVGSQRPGAEHVGDPRFIGGENEHERGRNPPLFGAAYPSPLKPLRPSTSPRSTRSPTGLG